MLETPVLFLIFNRVETAVDVFEEIRKARPKQLFIAADGPRKNNQSDQYKCPEARNQILNRIDWPCELKTLFRAENLGCGKAVSQAITWFFDHVEQGIILEDDCLPNQDFFHFCEELLLKYANDELIASISGSNLLGTYNHKKDSYFFAHGGIWGWATWKRAWALYDFDMKGWGQPEILQKIKENISGDNWYSFYFSLFESTHKKSIDTWDSQWFYTILVNNKLTINPKVNLVENIGFNIDGTHTSKTDGKISILKRYQLNFPLVHPQQKALNEKYLRFLYRHLYKPNWLINFLKKIKRKLINFRIK